MFHDILMTTDDLGQVKRATEIVLKCRRLSETVAKVVDGPVV